MKDLLIKKGLYSLTYIILAIVMESMTFIAMGIGVLPKYFMLDLSIILLIATFIFIIPSFKVQAIIITLLLTFQLVLSFLNYSLNNINGSIFTLDMLGLANEAAGAFTSSFISWGFFISLFLVVFACIAILILLKRYKVKQSFRIHLIAVLFVAMCIMSVSCFSFYTLTVSLLYEPEDESDPLYILKSDKYLYESFVIKDSAFKKFGSFAFYYNNLDQIISNTLITGGSSETDANEILSERLKTLNSYFSVNKMNERTSYTGMLKNDNLIVVMIESGEWYAIDEYLTPTLYALSHQGISANNYYSKDKTNHSETISILGSYPINSSFTTNFSSSDKLLNNNLAFTLPNILKSDGYTTSFFHDNSGTFYGRKSTHTVYGFDKVVTLEDMYELKGNTQKEDFYDFDLDSEMIRTNIDEIVPVGQKFYSFITTLTTHGSYEDLIKYGDYTADLTDEEKAKLENEYVVKGLGEYYEKINFELFNNKFSEILSANDLTEKEINQIYLRYKRYQAAMMDLDKGMQYLLEDLQSKGILQETSILMFSDHSAYYNNLNYYLKGVKNEQYYDTNLYRVPMYLYSGKSALNIPSANFYNAGTSTAFNGVKFDRFCTSFDIVPTILDLFNYNFNSGLYMGSSAFESESKIAFVSRESGILNDKFYTSDGEKILYGAERELYEQFEFKQKIVRYMEKQQYFEEMYALDFFKYKNQYSNANITKLVYKW